jgi:ubiquinone/menaquinone biosynthesis C-methylase UbiE
VNSRRDAGTIWSEAGVPEFYEKHRLTTADVYPSEWFFLEKLLSEGMSVLDIGCALGGFASILGEHLSDFTYVGLDISPEMIRRAKERYPGHEFHVIAQGDLSPVEGRRFDLVLSLGILHLSVGWRELIAEAWKRAGRFLLLDLRETSGATIEDEGRSYFKMEIYTNREGDARLPYNLINSAEAWKTIGDSCTGYKSLRHYGYVAPVSQSAVTPVSQVLMNTYCIEAPTA